jgi:hypothetical protein
MAETRLLISIIGSAAERGARVVTKALNSIGLSALEAGKKVEIFNAKYIQGLQEIQGEAASLETNADKLAFFEQALQAYANGTDEAVAGTQAFAASLSGIQSPDLDVDVPAAEVKEGAEAFDELKGAIDAVAEKSLDSLDKAFDGVIKKGQAVFTNVRDTTKGLLGLATKFRVPAIGATTFAAGLAAVASSSKDLSGALKILDIRLLRTGNIAGASRSEIIQLADDLEALYGLNSNDFIRGIERLGRFENIAVPLKEVAKAATDFAAIEGLPVTDAFQQFGEILNDPIRNINRLRDLGIQFSDEVVKGFKESGDVIGAQKAILEEFNAVIGGAASGNIESLGGSLTNLKNAFFGLFTNEQVARDFKSNVIEPIFTGINDLATFLRSESVQNLFGAIAFAITEVTGAVVGLIDATLRFPVDTFNSIADAWDRLTGERPDPGEALNFDDALSGIQDLNSELLLLAASPAFSGELIPGLDFTKVLDSKDEALAGLADLRQAATDTFQAFVDKKIERVLSTKGIQDDIKLANELGDLLNRTGEFVEELRRKKGLGLIDQENLDIAEQSYRDLIAKVLEFDRQRAAARERAEAPGERAGSATGLGGGDTEDKRTTPQDVIDDLNKQIELTKELSDVRREYIELSEDFTDAEKAANEERITGLIEEREANQQYLDGIKAAEALIEQTTAATRTQAEAQAGLSKEQSQYNRLLEEYPDIPETLREQLRLTLENAQATREWAEAEKEREKNYKDVASALEGTLTPLEQQEMKIQSLAEKWAALTEEQQRNLGGEEAFREAIKRMGEDYDELAEKGKETWLDLDAVAEQTARAMHSNFSSLFFDVMQGDFDNLGDRFKKTIDRMVSDLLASKLLESIAPKEGGGGIGGPLGAFIGAFTGGGQEDQGLSEGNPATEVLESVGQATTQSTGEIVQASQAGSQAVVTAVNAGTMSGFQQGQAIGSISDPIGLGAGTIASLRAPIMISSLSINELARAIGAEMAAIAAGTGGAGGGGGGGGMNLLGSVSSFLPFPYNLLGSFGGSAGGGGGGGATNPPPPAEKGGFIRPSELVEVNEKGEEIVRIGGMDILLPSPNTKIQMNTPLPIKGFASGGLVNPNDMVEVNELGTEALSISGEQLIIGSGEDRGSFGTLKSLIRSQQRSSGQPQVFHIGSRTFMKMGTQPGFVIPHKETKEIVQKQLMDDAKLSAVPGREFGGSVQSRGVYEVNEGVMPELLTIGSRDFLLTGGTSGMVTPMESASELGMSQNINVTIVTPDVDGFRKTQDQIQNEMGRAANLANRRNG